jgi:hypothetical protein
LQQALIDADYPLPQFGVDGQYEDETAGAVEAFRRGHGLTPSGDADAACLAALGAAHDTHQAVATIAGRQQANQPLAGTRAITTDEAAAFQRAISTEPRTATGGVPTFEPDNAHGNYEQRARAHMAHVLDVLHQHATTMAADRQQPDAVHQWGDVEQVADAAKTEADRVFGGYASGPAFRAGGNLFDAWEVETDRIANEPGYDDYIVNDLASYLINTELRGINAEHGAVPSRGPEATILAAIERDLLANDRQRLLDIQVSWPGLADNGQIFLQRLRAADDAGNRDFMWEQFATIIHEYIHTLEHADHQTYRGGLAEQAGGLTLREGMCDYFTTMVWDTVDFTNVQIAQTVEGRYHTAASHNIPQPGYYASKAQAERAAGIVGVRNVMGAFFRGELDLIGGP